MKFGRQYLRSDCSVVVRLDHYIALLSYVHARCFNIKIKDTPKMFDETETERVRKLAKSIRKNNEAKQSLLKLNYHSKPNAKKSVNSSGNNTTGNSSNSKSSSGSNGRSNNFNGSPSNVSSGSNNTNSANGTNNRFQKNKK
ncbi:hypothetical protein ACTFIW_008761 [Dictyostelium discoideum]